MSVSDVITALTTAFTDISGSMLSALVGILPICLTVIGAVMVARFGVNFFKTTTSKGRP